MIRRTLGVDGVREEAEDELYARASDGMRKGESAGGLCRCINLASEGSGFTSWLMGSSLARKNANVMLPYVSTVSDFSSRAKSRRKDAVHDQSKADSSYVVAVSGEARTTMWQ